MLVRHQRIGQQPLAHGFDVGLGLAGVAGRQLDLEIFALAHVLHAVEAQAAQRMGDGLALRIQNGWLNASAKNCPAWVSLL